MPLPPRPRLGVALWTLLAALTLQVATPAQTAKPKARVKAKSAATGTSKKAAKAADEAKSKADPDEPAPGDEPDADPGKTTTDAQPDERRPNLFGDTSRFTRLGGWGSIGGTMGQWGMARSMLVLMPPVQDELKLTEAQKTRVKSWVEGMRERGEEMGRRMREEAGDPDPQEDVPIAARIFQFTRMMTQVGDLVRENETGLAEILDRKQRTRLNQIALQMEGIAAVTRPEVAQAINLGPDQVELIQQYLAQSRLMQMTTWIERGVAMGRRFRPAPGEGADPGRTRPESSRSAPPARDGAPPADAPDAKAAGRTSRPEAATGREAAPGREATPGREGAADPARAARAREMRKEFESMRQRTDAIQDETVRQVLKVLTRKQRASFEKLLGPPFDPATLNATGRRPGEGASPAASPSPEPDPKSKPKDQASSGRGSGRPPSSQGASR